MISLIHISAKIINFLSSSNRSREFQFPSITKFLPIFTASPEEREQFAAELLRPLRRIEAPDTTSSSSAETLSHSPSVYFFEKKLLKKQMHESRWPRIIWKDSFWLVTRFLRVKSICCKFLQTVLNFIILSFDQDSNSSIQIYETLFLHFWSKEKGDESKRKVKNGERMEGRERLRELDPLKSERYNFVGIELILVPANRGLFISP